MKRFLSLLLLAAAALPALALVHVEGDPSWCRTAPTNGAPWDSVVLCPGGGTATYVGSGAFLTANHVGIGGSFVINGIAYPVDRQVTLGANYDPWLPDAKVVFVRGVPPLQPVRMYAGDMWDHFQEDVLVVGWGQPAGAEVFYSGIIAYKWGSESVPKRRWGWGRNLYGWCYVSGAQYNMPGAKFSHYMDGDAVAGIIGDSGAPWMIQHAGQWQIIAVMTTVTGGREIYFTQQPTEWSFNGGVRIEEYAHLVQFAAFQTKFGVKAAADDRDSDGIPALMEYATGLNPEAKDAAPLKVDIAAGAVTLSWPANRSMVDYELFLETSLDCVAWTKVTATPTVKSRYGSFDNNQVVLPTAGNGFFRLAVRAKG